MTNHAFAYVLRIAASQISGDGPQCAANLTRQLIHDEPNDWDEQSIARAVAHVIAALDRLPYTTRRLFEVAA